MPRYGGGHEDFEEQRKEIEALNASRKRLAAGEAQMEQQLEKSSAALDDNAKKVTTRQRAKKEQQDVDTRSARSITEGTDAIKLDTRAIEENTAARQRAARSAAFGQQALRGGQAPQFSEAYRLQQERGAPIGTNEIRRLGQQYGQGGYRRATDVQQALAAGLTPGTSASHDVTTRLESAQRDVVAADLEYARARDAYTKAIKGGDEAEAQAAFATKAAADERRKSAASTLANAPQAEAEAINQNRQRIQREIAARQHVIDTLTQEARIERLALPAPGQTVQGMPVGLAETRTRVDLPVPLRTPEADPGYQPNWTPGSAAAGAEQAAAASQASAAAHQANLTAIAQEAEAQGRLTDAAKIYAGELNNEARAIALVNAEQGKFYSENAAGSQARVSQALRDTNVAFYSLDQSMHRHGALTSEFIAAAARGEVTLKEMGNQALITAGKFGGWTVAATAVYGVVGALGEVGKGAMAASAGVDQAYRVITSGQNSSALQKSFADLSRQFNVPIETAADAVYRMGQVFHNQDDAVKAAQASLYSYKTGEVDVATSTRNLIAIQRAFGLSSNDLVSTYDQINQAQNQFGISIGDVESGLAKAGGSWRNAGGDLNYLLGLFIAIQKATGRSGEQIGTGLSRLYFVQHPENAKKLQDLGVDVDPTQVQKTFQSAFTVAQQHPERIQQLASGLLGNQYAPLLTATLRNQKLLTDALKETDPNVAKGSAANELKRVLGQVDEQVKELVNGFQRIGEELARAGAFNAFGIMLHTANDLLNVVEKILSVFNEIPAPIREGIVMMAELYAAVALLRRVGATERFANTPLGGLADPVGRNRTHTIAGLRTFQTNASNNAERVGARADSAAFTAEADRRYANALHARAATLEGLDAEDATRIRALEQADVMEQRAQRSEATLLEANKQLEIARRQAAFAEEELAAATATSRKTFEATAAQRGWVMPRELDQPNTAGVGPSVAAGAVAGSVGGVAAGEAGAAAAAAGAARTAAGVKAVETRAATMAASIAAISGPGQRLGYTGLAVSSAVSRGGAGMGAAARGMAKIGTGVRGLGASVLAFGAALGPLDIALIALIGVGYVYNKISNINKNSKALGDAITQQVGSLQEMKKQQDDINKVMATADAAQPSGSSPVSTPRGVSTWHGISNPFSRVSVDIHSLIDQMNGTKKKAEDAQKEIDDRLNQQAAEEAAGKPVTNLTYDQLIKRIQDDQKKRAAGLISQSQFDKLMAQHAVELTKLLNATAAQRQQAAQALADANRAAHNQGYYQSLLGMNSTDFSKEQQGQTAAVSLYGLTPHNLDYLKQQYKAAENKYRNSNKPDDLIALAQAREAYFSAVTGEVQKELQFELSGASNEAQRRTAYEKAMNDYRRAEIKTDQQNKRRLDDLKNLDKQEKDRLKKQQQIQDQGGLKHQAYDTDGLQPGQGPSGGNAPQLSDAQTKQREEKQRRQWQDLLKKQKARRAALNADIARQNRDLTEAELELKQAAYDDRQQGRETLLNLQVAGTQDPLKQASLRIAEATKQVQDAEASYGNQSRQYRTALTALRQAQTEQAQAILASVQANNALLEAQAGDDPVKQAQQAAKDSQTLLGTMLKNKSQFDPNAIKQQRADVINSQRAARQAADQQAQDIARLQGELATAQAGGDPVPAARAAITSAKLALAQAKTPVERLQALVDLTNANNQLQEAIAQREQARFNLLKSQTDDPVAQAKLDVQAAAAALSGSKGYDRMQKQADYNNAKRAYQDAQIQDKEDTIDFNLQMDKITADQAADQLEQLAKIKGISKQKKRELLEQAKSLRDQADGDYQLDVGNIRLPSLYEVRRFVQGGQPNASQISTDNRIFNVNISTAEAADAFAKNLETTNGTAAKSTARSMQMR